MPSLLGPPPTHVLLTVATVVGKRLSCPQPHPSSSSWAGCLGVGGLGGRGQGRVFWPWPGWIARFGFGAGPSRPGNVSWKPTGQPAAAAGISVGTMSLHRRSTLPQAKHSVRWVREPLGDKLLCFSVSSSPACPPLSQHCAWRTQMCVFPTAAPHPCFHPGHGGHRAARVGRDPPYLSCLPHFRAVK